MYQLTISFGRMVVQRMGYTIVQLRSKRELIEKFIAENLPHITSADAVPQSFDDYLEAEKDKALDKLSAEESLNKEGLQKLISDYLFTERTPLNDEVVSILTEKPKLLARRSIVERVKDKIMDFIQTFFDDVPVVN